MQPRIDVAKKLLFMRFFYYCFAALMRRCCAALIPSCLRHSVIVWLLKLHTKPYSYHHSSSSTPNG